jgi:hypothetical protein
LTKSENEHRSLKETGEIAALRKYGRVGQFLRGRRKGVLSGDSRVTVTLLLREKQIRLSKASQLSS